MSGFHIFPFSTEKREKQKSQHNQNKLWRCRARKGGRSLCLPCWVVVRRGVKSCYAVRGSISCKKRNFPSALSFLLGKAPVSHFAKRGWLSRALCAPNSASKKEKEKRRPGKDRSVSGLLESEGLPMKLSRWTERPWALPVNQSLRRRWWQPFPWSLVSCWLDC